MIPLLQQAPVWEITGAEFSKSEMHTADGISIRFPRMTRIRDDKDWKTATNLHQLKVGYHHFNSQTHDGLMVLILYSSSWVHKEKNVGRKE